MSAKGGFDLETRRLRAASEVRPEYFDDFSRLVKSVRAATGFQFLVLEFNDELDRGALIAKLDDLLAAENRRSAIVDIGYPAGRSIERFAEVEKQMGALSADGALIHLVGGETWFDKARWQAFNLRREVVSSQLSTCLLIWLTPSAVSDMAVSAPDLWAWRGGVYSFLRAGRAAPAEREDRLQSNKIDRATRARRIGEIRADLAASEPLDAELRFRLLEQLSQHLENAGDGEEALRTALELRQAADSLGDKRSLARALERAASISRTRGDDDEALRICREELVPLYESLGDVLSLAFTKSSTAIILTSMDRADEALRVCQEEALPLFERLGDPFWIANAQDNIAYVLEAQGKLDESLELRQNTVLPVYQQFGDPGRIALAQFYIAQTMGARGQLTEALRVLQEEVLPVYENLAQFAWIAIVKGEVARNLRAQNHDDEALRLLEEEVLPIYERLGDRRGVALAEIDIADILASRGRYDEALRICENEVVPNLLAANLHGCGSIAAA